MVHGLHQMFLNTSCPWGFAEESIGICLIAQIAGHCIAMHVLRYGIYFQRFTLLVQTSNLFERSAGEIFHIQTHFSISSYSTILEIGSNIDQFFLYQNTS